MRPNVPDSLAEEARESLRGYLRPHDLGRILGQKLAVINDQFLPAQAYMDKWGYAWYGNDSMRVKP